MIYTVKEKNDFKKTENLFEQFSKSVSPSNQTNVEFSKKNGNTVFGIVKESGQYIVKSTNKKSPKLFAEDFDYLDGYESRKKHQRRTLQEAIKYLHLVINEDKYVLDVPNPTPQPAPAPVPMDNTPDAQVPPEVDGSQDASLDSNVEGEDTAESDDEKEIQKLTGTLAQDLRTQIDSDNEPFTVGMFKSIIAAAKNLSPENKTKVMNKAEEVLGQDEESLDQGNAEPQDNTEPQNGANQMQQPKLNEDLDALKQKLHHKDEKPSLSSGAQGLLQTLNNLQTSVETLYAEKYGISVMEDVSKFKLEISSEAHKKGIVVIKAIPKNLQNADKKYFKGYYENANGDWESVKDLKESDLLRYISAVLESYDFDGDYEEFLEKQEKYTNEKGNPKQAIAGIKSHFLPNPYIVDVKERTERNAGAIRFISVGKNPDLFVFYSGAVKEPYDLYVVEKSNVSAFISADSKSPHTFGDASEDKLKDGKINSSIYTYMYADMTEEGSKGRASVYVRIQEYLDDLAKNNGPISESVFMTKKQLFESLGIK